MFDYEKIEALNKEIETLKSILADVIKTFGEDDRRVKTLNKIIDDGVRQVNREYGMEVYS